MPSCPFQLEGQVFDGVEIVSASHMNVKNKVLNPDRSVYSSVVCLDVYGFKPLWKFMVQHFIGEAQGCATPLYLGVSDGCSVRFWLCARARFLDP